MDQKKLSAAANYIVEFYLDEEQKEKVRRMSRFNRWIYTSWWVFKGMIDKLSHARRVMVIIGTVLLFFEIRFLHFRSNFNFLGYLLLILVLMLELKDKLLAKDELREGRAVQLALLPESSPAVPGWDLWLCSRPANDVGGDLLDFISIEENCWGITLGDVSGKGLPAALLMAQLQSTLRAVLPFSTGNSDLLAKINDIFNRYGLKKSFISLVFLSLRSDSAQISLVNAGHPAPLLLRRTGIEDLERGGPAIGLNSELQIPEQQVELAAGESLLVYSDGLTEARNDEGRFFGIERLRSLLENTGGLPAAELGRKLLQAVEEFIQAAPPHDDLSLLIARRTGD